MPTTTPRHQRLGFWRSATRFALLAALMWAGWLKGFPTIPQEPLTVSVGPAPVVWLADTRDLSGGLSARANTAMPLQPLEGQETRASHCMAAGEIINGGCWIALRSPPPCPTGTFNNRGTCYAPQTRTPDLPVSGR